MFKKALQFVGLDSKITFTSSKVYIISSKKFKIVICNVVCLMKHISGIIIKQLTLLKRIVQYVNFIIVIVLFYY